ncbi:MAG: hypothetical protein HC934_06880 [Acaryochloridaceae cyanobacterium SU_2_1]|nr:hypothetical protein [Acaryochloridaceae cyanobacterium SU_2_1]
MKVIQRTSALLVVQEHLLAVRCMGGLAAAIGFLIFIIFEFPFDLFGCLCIGTAALMSMLNPVEICTLNKATNSMTLEKRRWLSRKIQHHQISQIKEICIDKQQWLGTEFYRIGFHFTSGKHFHLTQFPTTDRAAQQLIAQHIRDFLQDRCLAPSL